MAVSDHRHTELVQAYCHISIWEAQMMRVTSFTIPALKTESETARAMQGQKCQGIGHEDWNFVTSGIRQAPKYPSTVCRTPRIHHVHLIIRSQSGLVLVEHPSIGRIKIRKKKNKSLVSGGQWGTELIKNLGQKSNNSKHKQKSIIQKKVIFSNGKVSCVSEWKVNFKDIVY